MMTAVTPTSFEDRGGDLTICDGEYCDRCPLADALDCMAEQCARRDRAREIVRAAGMNKRIIRAFLRRIGLWFERLVWAQHNARVLGEMEHRMSYVLDDVTNGRLSKPYYDLNLMRAMISEAQREAGRDSYDDGRKDLLEELGIKDPAKDPVDTTGKLARRCAGIACHVGNVTGFGCWGAVCAVDALIECDVLRFAGAD